MSDGSPSAAREREVVLAPLGRRFPRPHSASPVWSDGGYVTAANLALWAPEEGFGVENVGVPPDIEVEQLPAEVAAGKDPQLDKAIEVVLAELAKHSTKAPERPAFPVRVRK